MIESFNCPNCGAPINGDLCPYCGTAFIDWSAIDIHKPNWIKVKIDDKIVLVKAILADVSIHADYLEPVSYYLDTFDAYCIETNPGIEIDSTLTCIPFTMPGSTKKALFVTIDKSTADLQNAGEMVHEIMRREQK